MKKHDSRPILIVICLSAIIIAPILRYYAFDIYRWFWHRLNNGRVYWNDLAISVPSKLIARTYNKGSTKELHVYDPEDPDRAVIFFKKVSHNISNDFDFAKKHECAGYKIIEQKECYILDHPCVWIKAIREEKETIYTERVYFSLMDMEISFIGHPDNRQFLVKMLDSLQSESVNSP